MIIQQMAMIRADGAAEVSVTGTARGGFGELLRSYRSWVPAGPDARAGMLRTVLARRRMLIVLDNTASASQVRPLLPGHPGCLVLVTSRNRLGGLTALDGAERITLGTLTPADSLTLLVRIAGPDRIDADPGAAALARQCGYLPLALAIIADSIASRAGMSLATLVGELADETGRLDALAVEGDPSTGVRAAISWSYRALAPGPASGTPSMPQPSSRGQLGPIGRRASQAQASRRPGDLRRFGASGGSQQ